MNPPRCHERVRSFLTALRPGEGHRGVHTCPRHSVNPWLPTSVLFDVCPTASYGVPHLEGSDGVESSAFQGQVIVGRVGHIQASLGMGHPTPRGPSTAVDAWATERRNESRDVGSRVGRHRMGPARSGKSTQRRRQPGRPCRGEGLCDGRVAFRVSDKVHDARCCCWIPVDLIASECPTAVPLALCIMSRGHDQVNARPVALRVRF